MRKTLALLSLLIVTSCCVTAQSAESQIRKARAASNDAIARHDAAGIVRDMLPDYSIVTGRGQHVNGKDKVYAFWQTTIKTMPGVTYVRTPTSVVISKNDSIGWETGRWTAVHSYSNGGNYSAMWRRSGDNWKLAAELFVSLEK